ncbi:hypothetical protein ACFY4C_33855 [Actinomadura viridis]|uniref:hypothetical protein n=1 Tax=Actinomadura viridis TaxID=58110 RepID=UPI0036B760E7
MGLGGIVVAAPPGHQRQPELGELQGGSRGQFPGLPAGALVQVACPFEITLQQRDPAQRGELERDLVPIPSSPASRRASRRSAAERP